MSALLLLFALISHVVDPLFPPNAVMGGTVVAQVHFAGGKAKSVKVLSGEDPFADSARAALLKWQGDSGEDSDEVVIVHFRHPYLYHVADSSEEIAPAQPKGSLPYPKTVISPAYAPNTSAQGSVVLRLEISSEGRVVKVAILQRLGDMTTSSIDAVRSWVFTPPEDEKGAKQPSHAYAVFVYRFPVSVRRQ